jgi:hypothetical protein
MRFKRCSLLLDVGVSAGIGWTEDTVRSKSSHVVDALHPSGTGIIEYEVCGLWSARVSACIEAVGMSLRTSVHKFRRARLGEAPPCSVLCVVND